MVLLGNVRTIKRKTQLSIDNKILGVAIILDPLIQGYFHTL